MKTYNRTKELSTEFADPIKHAQNVEIALTMFVASVKPQSAKNASIGIKLQNVLEALYSTNK